MELCAGVMSGQLIRQAVIMVIYQDNSARGDEDTQSMIFMFIFILNHKVGI